MRSKALTRPMFYYLTYKKDYLFSLTPLNLFHAKTLNSTQITLLLLHFSPRGPIC
jgi:hypothetical protein